MGLDGQMEARSWTGGRGQIRRKQQVGKMFDEVTHELTAERRAFAVNQTQVFQKSGRFFFFSFLCRDSCCVLLSDVWHQRPVFTPVHDIKSQQTRLFCEL